MATQEGLDSHYFLEAYSSHGHFYELYKQGVREFQRQEWVDTQDPQWKTAELYTEDFSLQRAEEYLAEHPEYKDAEDALNHIAIEQERYFVSSSPRRNGKWPIFITSDAEEAKQNGGMIALRLRTSDAQALAIPGYEPVEDLHITLLFMGKEVDPQVPLPILEACDYTALNFSPIFARVGGRAEFNPGSPDSCAVYLVTGSSDLEQLRDMILRELLGKVEIPEQHEPWTPHITAGYGLSPAMLTYTGEICIDRITVNWAGQEQEWKL